MTQLTRGQIIASDIAALLRARNPLLWIVTREEARVESLLFEAAAASGYEAHTWDIAQGAREFNGASISNMSAKESPDEMIDAIRDRAENGGTRDVWIMRDLPVWLEGAPAAPTLRKLRNLVRAVPMAARDRAQAVIVLTTSANVPNDLAGHATVIEWPLPDRAEIGEILDSVISSLPDGIRDKAASPEARNAAIDAAVGLTGEEAQACYARSLVQTRTIEPATVANEKRRVIARERVLEWYDPLPGGLDAVGGLENLKTWLMSRRSAYSQKAREYGLPAPKGAFLVGIPGCGKSLTAKAIATAWGVPLLRLDLGALKSKFVGESEGNLRKAFRVIEAIGRCVVWLDEIEKALGGSQGASDGGVSSDALGAILSWMQERQGEAFVFATANDVEALPPELLRKGRFDEVWWVDLPTVQERCSVLTAALKAHGRDAASINLLDVSKACPDFTGSEVASLVPDALYAAFDEGARAITTDDLITAAGNVTPLAKTAEEKIRRLREWAKGRARPASVIQAASKVKTTSRELDI